MDGSSLLWTALAAVLPALAVGLQARRHRETTTPVGWLRLLRREGTVLGWLAGTAVGLWGGTPGIVAGLVGATVPSLGAGATVVVGSALALAFPAVLAALATRLATLPLQRTVDRLPLSYRDALRFELERGVAGALALVGAVVVVAALPAGWPRVVGPVVLGGLATAATPAWLAVSLRTRPPTDEELLAVEDALPADVGLLIVDDWSRVGTAMAAGLAPGPRYVFLTAALFETLDPPQLRAVVAHEVGHHRRHHVALRYGLLAGAAGPLLAVVEFAPGLLGPALVLTVPYGLGALAVLRRCEYAADDAAADQGRGEALAAALETLMGRGILARIPGGVGRLLAAHPPLTERIGRLRER